MTVDSRQWAWASEPWTSMPRISLHMKTKLERLYTDKIFLQYIHTNGLHYLQCNPFIYVINKFHQSRNPLIDNWISLIDNIELLIMYNRDFTSPIPIPRPRQGPHTIHPHKHTKKKSPPPVSPDRGDIKKRRRPPTLPHCIAVPSAQAGLTSLFGMGRGGTPPQ